VPPYQRFTPVFGAPCHGGLAT